jgi:translation initiation factor RLI1
LKPDTIEGGSDVEMPEFNVSYKPQTISGKSQSQVRHLLHEKIPDAYTHPQFISDVMKPLLIEQLMDREVQNLSGGELQRVALCLCLGKVFYVSSFGLLVPFYILEYICSFLYTCGIWLFQRESFTLD